MIGVEIREIAKTCSGAEYQRLAVNGRGVAVYYSFFYRHALLTRHGVVFKAIANIDPDDAQKEWHRMVEIIDHPKRTLPVERHDWQTVLMTDAVVTETNAFRMYTALKAIYIATHDNNGTLLKTIRPSGLRGALDLVADSVYGEVSEDIRKALRCTPPQTQKQTEEDARREQDRCLTPFFLQGECTNCGASFAEHSEGKAW